jgi:hypothetical protein
VVHDDLLTEPVSMSRLKRCQNWTELLQCNNKQYK